MGNKQPKRGARYVNSWPAWGRKLWRESCLRSTNLQPREPVKVMSKQLFCPECAAQMRPERGPFPKFYFCSECSHGCHKNDCFDSTSKVRRHNKQIDESGTRLFCPTCAGKLPTPEYHIGSDDMATSCEACKMLHPSSHCFTSAEAAQRHIKSVAVDDPSLFCPECASELTPTNDVDKKRKWYHCNKCYKLYVDWQCCRSPEEAQGHDTYNDQKSNIYAMIYGASNPESPVIQYKNLFTVILCSPWENIDD